MEVVAGPRPSIEEAQARVDRGKGKQQPQGTAQLREILKETLAKPDHSDEDYEAPAEALEEVIADEARAEAPDEGASDV